MRFQWDEKLWYKKLYLLFKKEPNFLPLRKIQKSQLYDRLKTILAALRFLIGEEDIVPGLDFVLHHTAEGKTLLQQHTEAKEG